MRKLFRKAESSPPVQQAQLDSGLVFDAIDSPILVLDAAGKIKRANQAAIRVFGTRRELLLEKPLHSLQPREFCVRLAEQVGLSQQVRYPTSGEVVDESQGAVWEFATSLSPTAAADEGMILILRDVTQRKRDERMLRWRGEYLAALNEITFGLMNRLDLDLLLESIVTRACAVVGVSNGHIAVIEPGGYEMRTRVEVGALRGSVSSEQASAPIKSDSQVIGVLAVASAEGERQFEKEDFEVLSNFAQLASIALDNAQMYRTVQLELVERKRAEDARNDSEDKYKLLFQSNPHPLWVYDAETLSFLAVNDSAIRLYGYSFEEFLTMTIKDLGCAGETGPLLLSLAKAAPGLTGEGTWRHLKKDRTTIDVEITSHETLFGARPAVLVMVNDITDRKRAQEELQVREKHFRSLIENASDLILILNEHGTLGYVSPSVERALGYSAEELVCRSIFEFIHPEDFSGAFSAIMHALESPGEGPTVELRVRQKQGHWRMYEAIGKCIIDGAEQPSIIINARDITDRKAAEAQLLHDALHDVLTGLPNRVLVLDRLGQAIKRAKRRDDYLFAMLFLDLDHFKFVNDSLGHIAGDQLLVAAARRLESCLRPADTIARFGGDEFVVLLDDIEDASAATLVGEKIQKELSAPFDLNGQPVYMTVSIGIALSTTGYDKPEDILRDADTALYRAKSRGKSCHEVFDKAMHASAVKRLQLQSDLRQAIERNEFLLHYQPIVSLETGMMDGFEALIRWQHPRFGLVPPSDFIPVAEETRLVIPIGHWVLREACRQMSEWQADVPGHTSLSISVNLSNKQLTQPDLADQVRSVLQETGLDPRSLKLEITESVFLENPELMASVFSQLKALDVQLQIDDFGTGYSSLSYLHRLPVDTLKIDQSFVSSMKTNSKNAEIVRTIVMLAHNLGMTVTAEGVETLDQLSALSALKCEYGQGYLFSEPVEGGVAKSLLAFQEKGKEGRAVEARPFCGGGGGSQRRELFAKLLDSRV